MLSRYGVFVCILFLFSALTACDSVETEDMLTEQEVDALFTAIGTGFGLLEMENPVENPEPPVSDGMPPDENLEIAIDTVASCSGGGSIRAQGMSMTEISGEGRIADNIDLSLFPSECVMTVDDVTFTLASESGVRLQSMVSFTASQTDSTASIISTTVSTTTGMVDWEVGGRSGACEVDLSTDVRIELSFGQAPDEGILLGGNIDVEGGTSGMLCDTPVERDVELDLEDLDPGADPAASRVAMSRRLLRL